MTFGPDGDVCLEGEAGLSQEMPQEPLGQQVKEELVQIESQYSAGIERIGLC